jgi:hypothetical protein
MVSSLLIFTGKECAGTSPFIKQKRIIDDCCFFTSSLYFPFLHTSSFSKDDKAPSSMMAIYRGKSVQSISLAMSKIKEGT